MEKRIKLLHNYYLNDLEKSINNWLTSRNGKLHEIKINHVGDKFVYAHFYGVIIWTPQDPQDLEINNGD